LACHLAGRRRCGERRIRTVKIFLASPAELRPDRDDFKLAVAARNDAWLHHGVLLQLVAWEHVLDLITADGLQQAHHRAIAQCDLFVMLFHTKVGRHTLEEFEPGAGAGAPRRPGQRRRPAGAARRPARSPATRRAGGRCRSLVPPTGARAAPLSRGPAPQRARPQPGFTAAGLRPPRT
jgi:hypothetical protein